VPVEVVYAEIRKMFKDGFHVMPGWTIDFCSGWCPECAFAEYCDSCKETWTIEELEKEGFATISKYTKKVIYRL
jgi:hypothetical protein